MFQKSLVSWRQGAVCYRFPALITARLRSVVASYDGQFQFAGKLAVWNRILQRFPFLSRYLTLHMTGKWVAADAAPRAFPDLRSQYGWFARRYSGCLMAFQIGSYYEFFHGHARRAADALSLQPGRARRGLGRGVGLPVLNTTRALSTLAAPDRPVAIIDQLEGMAGNVKSRKLSKLSFDRRGMGTNSEVDSAGREAGFTAGWMRKSG
jgi:hypothetical protein